MRNLHSGHLVASFLLCILGLCFSACNTDAVNKPKVTKVLVKNQPKPPTDHESCLEIKFHESLSSDIGNLRIIILDTKTAPPYDTITHPSEALIQQQSINDDLVLGRVFVKHALSDETDRYLINITGPGIEHETHFKLEYAESMNCL